MVGEWLISIVDLEQHNIMEYIERHSGNRATFLRGDLSESSKIQTRANLHAAHIHMLELCKVVISY